MSTYPYCACENYCPDDFHLVGDYRLCNHCAEGWAERYQQLMLDAIASIERHHCPMQVERAGDAEPCDKPVVGLAACAFDGRLYIEPMCGHHLRLAGKANHIPLSEVIAYARKGWRR